MKAIERTGVDYYIQVSDVELIQRVMAMLPEEPICINIGAAMGTSTLAMLEARQDATVVSIDIKECPLEKEALDQSGIDYADRYTFVQGMSQEVGITWPDRSVDFVFVDGGHSYDECAHDGAVWCLALKSGGYIAFHDYEADMLPAIKPAVDKVAEMFGLEKVDHVGKLIVFRKPHEDLSD